MYIKIVYSNGFCGCDEYEYVEVADEKEANEYVAEDIYNYSFFEPDASLIDVDDEEEVASYQQDIYDYSHWEEITKEEYEENA